LNAKTAEMLFELANADRLTILSEVDKEPLKLSQVARKLSATVQETSRHLERLTKARLVEKDSTSAYKTTHFGKLVLALLPSLEFLQRKREYLLTHDLSTLPQGFAERIGDLSEHTTWDRLDEALARAETVIKEAEEYVWILADQNVRQAYPHEHPKTVSRRLIIPRGSDLRTFEHIQNESGSELQVGFVDNVKVTIVMNETTALIYFPTLDCRMDFTQGFAGKSKKFHGYCHDLYNFYWDEATRKTW